MANTTDKLTFNNIPKMHIVKTIFKDKNGNIIGECKDEHTRHKTR